MDQASDREDATAAMRAAVVAARRGRPSPNPHVGAVVVREGVVVGVGHHPRFGEDHAEVQALREAGERAKGATVYVTLEPCNHHGRTPPCTEALLRAGVREVVYAVPDPNPHVAGGGARRLLEAGVRVSCGFHPELQREAERLLAPWVHTVLTGLAHVTLKAGMSLDGRIATRGGHSRWITSEVSRADAHALRARVDLVLVGSGTVLADDPSLTARLVPAEKQPVRAVIDGALRIPEGSAMVRSAREVPTWVFTRDLAHPRARLFEAAGVRLFEAAGPEGRVDLRRCLRHMAREGLVEVLCEGGGALHGALLAQGLAARVVCYLAPMVLGSGGTAAFGGPGPERLEEAPRLDDLRLSRCGADLKVEAELRASPPGGAPEERQDANEHP